MKGNPLMCIIACPLRERCTEIFELKAKIEQGIINNLLADKIHDSDAKYRALKHLYDMANVPPLLRDFCLLERKCDVCRLGEMVYDPQCYIWHCNRCSHWYRGDRNE